MHARCKSSLWPWLGVVVAAVMTDASAAPTVTNDTRKPGTVRMAKLLERVISEEQPMENRFLSRDRVQALRAAIAAGATPEKMLELQYALGTELLQAGDNQAALEQF